MSVLGFDRGIPGGSPTPPRKHDSLLVFVVKIGIVVFVLKNVMNMWG